MIHSDQIKSYSWDRIIEPKPFGEYSGSLLRACGNNPRKALVLLETPLGGESPRYIAEKVNNVLGILPEDYLRGLGGDTVISYFDNAILQLTLPLAEKARIKKRTGLAEREVQGYRKTPLGALLGDATAFLCLEESSSGLTKSSAYKIFGVANSRGKRYAPLTTLMILVWLHEKTKEGQTIRLMDFVDDYYEFDVDRFGRDSREYNELSESLSNCNLPRLAETGLVSYKSKHSKDEMKVAPKAEGSPLDPGRVRRLMGEYGKGTLAIYKMYAENVMSCLRDRKKPLSAAETFERTGINKSFVRGVLTMLRKVNMIKVVEGRTLEEYSELELTENGREFYKRYMKRWLYALGFEEAKGRNGVRERALDNVITPDHAEFLGMRREKLDSVASKESMDEFSRMCREAFSRHQQESGYMS
ncbi:MAG: hypothetical protein HYX24_04190 [Candidatus Aenigmarchaeota archaeon]|nr:hypothetical protein [Candidatus Aenigmarchaeota archaeon]